MLVDVVMLCALYAGSILFAFAPNEQMLVMCLISLLETLEVGSRWYASWSSR